MLSNAAGKLVLTGNAKMGTILFACFGATTFGTSLYDKVSNFSLSDIVRTALISGTQSALLGNSARSGGSGSGESSSGEFAAQALLSRGRADSALLDAVDAKLSRAVDRLELLGRAQSSQVLNAPRTRMIGASLLCYKNK
jgi:hypothetical protein